MPFFYDTDSNMIKMACGDTGGFGVAIDWSRLSPGDVILFAILDNNSASDLLCKTANIEDGYAYIRLCNHDTRDIPAGTYKWNLRIVTSPVFDDDGSVRVDECSDDVITVFDIPPRIKLIRGGAVV